jgi:hypothetical protein
MVQMKPRISQEAFDILTSLAEASGVDRDDVLDMIIKSAASLNKKAMVDLLITKAEEQYNEKLARIRALNPAK